MAEEVKKDGKVTVYGLEMDESTKEDTIQSTFGIPLEKYREVLSTIGAHMGSLLFAKKTKSTTEAFRLSLETEEFKKLGFELGTPNSYFMLGFLFQDAKMVLESLAGEIKAHAHAHEHGHPAHSEPALPGGADVLAKGQVQLDLDNPQKAIMQLHEETAKMEKEILKMAEEKAKNAPLVGQKKPSKYGKN